MMAIKQTASGYQVNDVHLIGHASSSQLRTKIYNETTILLFGRVTQSQCRFRLQPTAHSVSRLQERKKIFYNERQKPGWTRVVVCSATTNSHLPSASPGLPRVSHEPKCHMR